jgi:F0F1-type ATP synthase assembly protein I
MTEQDGPNPASLRPIGEYAVAGIEFALAILAFLYVGQVLDRRFGTSPWLVIIGACLGAIAGWCALYRKLSIDRKRVEKSHREQSDRPD